MQLTETVWAPGTHPQLDAAYEASRYDRKNPELEKRWAAYLAGDRPQIVLSTQVREDGEDFPTLEAYLGQQNPSTLLDSLFVVDSYYQSRVLGESLPTERSLGFAPDPILDELLSASDGILLWQFQFEQLAQLFVEQRSDAIELRHRINQKRLETRERIEGMTLPSGQSLRNVVQERMLYEGVVPGQWKSARMLSLAENRG